MKKNYSTIVAVLSCILAVVCLFQNYQLKQDIAYLKTQQSSIRSSVQTDMGNIYSQVQSMLEQVAKRIANIRLTVFLDDSFQSCHYGTEIYREEKQK